MKSTFESTEIRIQDFFKTGVFDTVYLGMTKTEVLNAWGKPSACTNLYHDLQELENEGEVCVLNNLACPLWFYGDTEFWFHDETFLLYRISLKDLNSWENEEGVKRKLDTWVFGVPRYQDNLTLERLKQALYGEQIHFTDYGFGSYLANIATVGKVILESGVEILYELKEGQAIIGLVHLQDKEMGA